MNPAPPAARAGYPAPVEAILLCGIQATGKSSFCKQRLFGTHVRINLDMLGTRHREALLLRACLEAGQPFVIDNTSPTRRDRQPYIVAARSAGFRVIGYYFESRIADAIVRNEAREAHEQVPQRGLHGTYARLEVPRLDEGFDELHYVRLVAGGFDVQPWRDDG